MGRKRNWKAYEPEITMAQVAAYRSDKPETHTGVGVIDAVCELFEKHPRVLAGGEVHDWLGMDSKHLAYTLEVLTGFTTTEFRAEVISRRWQILKAAHPEWKEKEIAHALGFTNYSVMWQFIDRHKRKFPEMFLGEVDRQDRMKVLVAKLMKDEDATVRRIYIGLPYKGGEAEEQACLETLYTHSRNVADLAQTVNALHPELGLRGSDVRMAALLHNIGIVWTNTPAIHCHGKEPYVCHGELGANWLMRKRQGFVVAVARRHLGAGISFEEAIEKI